MQRPLFFPEPIEFEGHVDIDVEVFQEGDLLDLFDQLPEGPNTFNPEAL